MLISIRLPRWLVPKRVREDLDRRVKLTGRASKVVFGDGAGKKR